MTIAQVIVYAISAFLSGWTVGFVIKSIIRLYSSFI